MPKFVLLLLAVCALGSSLPLFAKNQPASDPQALTFAAQSIAAMTGTVSIEKLANPSVRVVAATEMTFGRGVFAGEVGKTSLSLNSLPDAAMNRIPACSCAWIASVRAWEYSIPPQLLLLATML